jgi:hypothetical protein
MTQAIDTFARLLFNEAKAFFEKGHEASGEENQNAHFHASLLLGFCSIEAHVNSIAEEFHDRHDMMIHDHSILLEKKIKLERGKYVLTDDLQIFRLEDRLEYLFARLSTTALDKEAATWGNLKSALKLRNQLTHPKTPPSITERSVEDALRAILEMLNLLYKGIYSRPYPDYNYAMMTTLTL